VIIPDVVSQPNQVDFKLAHLLFYCTTDSRIELPAFKGSFFRGIYLDIKKCQAYPSYRICNIERVREIFLVQEYHHQC
jgi:hypothetical protein